MSFVVRSRTVNGFALASRPPLLSSIHWPHTCFYYETNNKMAMASYPVLRHTRHRSRMYGMSLVCDCTRFSLSLSAFSLLYSALLFSAHVWRSLSHGWAPMVDVGLSCLLMAADTALSAHRCAHATTLRLCFACLSLSLCPFSSFIWFVCGVLQNDIATCDVMQNAERHANPSSCSVSMDAMCMTTSEVEGIRCGVRCGSALQTQRHTPYLSTATIYGIRWPLMMRPAYARSLYAGRRTQTVSAHIATVVRRSQSGIGHYDVNELRHWFSDVVVGYTLSEDIIYMQHRRWTVAVKNARMDRMGDGNKMFAKCSRWRKCGWQI